MGAFLRAQPIYARLIITKDATSNFFPDTFRIAYAPPKLLRTRPVAQRRCAKQKVFQPVLRVFVRSRWGVRSESDANLSLKMTILVAFQQDRPSIAHSPAGTRLELAEYAKLVGISPLGRPEPSDQAIGGGDMILVNMLERTAESQKRGWQSQPVFLGKPLVAHSLVRVLIVGVAAMLLMAVAQDKADSKSAAMSVTVKMASPARLPNSFSFPDLPNYRDDGDVLDEYPAYLTFVVQMSERTQPKIAKGLEGKFNALRQRDPRGAANFLRGLREEILHKLQLTGVPVHRANASHPVLKKLVRDYLGEWYHEADEYLFRAVARRQEKN
ncbi:MAG: hypothetical protein KDD51_01375 [Bdellovibrionales bacterium]|nr:hypothetical protein [Bdellovibrionales bacterium]